MLPSKQPPVAWKFSRDGQFELHFEHCSFLWEKMRGQNVLAARCHLSVHVLVNVRSGIMHIHVSFCSKMSIHKNVGHRDGSSYM